MPTSSPVTAGRIALACQAAAAPRPVSLAARAGRIMTPAAAGPRLFSQGWARAFLREGL
ncbi:MAG: hypothetical protein ACK4M0_08785 [Phreatobacter sp.]